MFWSFPLQSRLQVELSGWQQSRPNQIKQDQPKWYIRAQTCEKYSKVLWSIQTSLYMKHITGLWHSKDLCCANRFPVLAVGLHRCYKWQYVPGVFFWGGGGGNYCQIAGCLGCEPRVAQLQRLLSAVQPGCNSAGWRPLQLGKREMWVYSHFIIPSHLPSKSGGCSPVLVSQSH